MSNEMMIAALQKQRQGKMSAPQASKTPDPATGDVASRVQALEEKYEKLCQFVGMNNEENEAQEYQK